MALLYLFLKLNCRVSGLEVSVSSDIPIGAGLGSSAAFSVALCGAFLAFRKLTKKESHVHFILQENMDEICQGAFNAEKIFHGTPSGRHFRLLK